MTVKDGKIVSCTEPELFAYWMSRFDSCYTFEEYKHACIKAGTEILEAKRFVPECKEFRSRRCYDECNWFAACQDFDDELIFFEEDNDLWTDIDDAAADRSAN